MKIIEESVRFGTDLFVVLVFTGFNLTSTEYMLEFQLQFQRFT